MADRMIEALANISRDAVSFHWLRETFKADNGLKDSLDWGHAVPDTTDKLDQYLWTYGPMIESQWQNAARLLGAIDPPALLIDYGCGQGLAGLLINDLTRGRLFDKLARIALIEPSAPNLARAEAIYRKVVPTARVFPIARYFDAVRSADIPTANGRTLHVFSNSLDLNSFDAQRLLLETLRPGRHTILSVSHDRPFRGGTPKIEGVRAALEAPGNPFGATVVTSTLLNFVCSNAMKGLAWYCELEIADG